jgi:sphingomyelin phosphodiesterase acid-like 3
MNRAPFKLQLTVVSLLSALLFAPLHARASTPVDPSVLMLSDINFDPFHDPAKFDQLRNAPVKKWLSILSQPDSPTQATEFAKLQAACSARGIDSSVDLLESSLQAAHRTQPKPAFITVSGDLIGHDFDCRYRKLMNGYVNPAYYNDFVSKTISFVAYRLWLTFPHTPVYVALGNHDSTCKDYAADANSSFLRDTATTVMGNSADPATRWSILYNFPHFGDYSVELPKPMHNTRLIVLQDTFESSQHTTCAGAASPDAIARQHIEWLRTQLASARKAHEKVWVMAHIPPGVDAYATVAKEQNVCTGGDPVMFHSSNALLHTITDYGDVVQLALFGHSHMDELRVYKSTTDVRPSQTYIPGKLVPSISPVDGNNPAFTIAQVDPRSATVRDYVVYSTDNITGLKAMWKPEYRYSTAYGMPDMSGASLEKVTTRLAKDTTGTALTSIDYERYFFAGDKQSHSATMQKSWPEYACSTTQQTAADFRSCACPVASARSGVSNPDVADAKPQTSY